MHYRIVVLGISLCITQNNCGDYIVWDDVLNCGFAEGLNNLISAACINKKIYLFQKNLANNNVTVFYNAEGTLISQPLFETTISPARIAVRDIDCDGHFEMAVIGNGLADFFRLSDETNITSWTPLSSDQLACICLSNFATVIFLKPAESEEEPLSPPIFPPLLFATVIIGFAIFYHPVKDYLTKRIRC